MKKSPNLAVTESGYRASAGLFFAFVLVFLQEGFSYYFSFQVLALLFVLVMAYVARPSLVSAELLFLVFFLLSVFIAFNAIYSPFIISRDSNNIFFTIVGLLTYALIIIGLTCIIPRRVDMILHTFRRASASAILALAALVVLAELSLLPYLNREALLLQNSRLVTNYASEDELMYGLALMESHNLAPRLDLFYGEPSYLGVVLFTCVVCYMLTSRLIGDFYSSSVSSFQMPSSIGTYNRYPVIIGVMSMIYLQSLSSIVYGVLVLLFEFREQIIKRLSISKIFLILLLLIFVALFFRQSLDYLFYRITMQDSLSVQQRFGSLTDFGLSEYFFGLRDESMVPDVGFHNGLFYTIAISGFSGIWYFLFILRTTYRLAKPMKMSMLTVLVILALIMQNGAVFSPNKVVLFALILLPLSCARMIYARKKSNLSKEVVG